MQTHCQLRIPLHSLCNICLSKRLRQFALQKSELTLNNFRSKVRSLESSETQAVEMELTAHRPPQSEDISSFKGHYKKRPNSHICGNGRPHTKPPGKSLHSQKCGKKWPHNRNPCPTQGCTYIGNVENQTTSPKCVELGSSQNEAWDNKTKSRLSLKKIHCSESSCSDWIFILDWQRQIQNPFSACKNQKNECQNQNDHWHGCLHWHTRNTATIVHVFACLEVNQPSSSKRAIPKHHLLPKPTMQHTVTCTRGRSWVTLQLQNYYCSWNSQPTSEPHTQPYSTTREIIYKIPYTVPRNRQAERGGGQITYWWKNKSCCTTAKKNSISHPPKSGSRATWAWIRYTCNWACIWSYSLGFSLVITPEKNDEVRIFIDMRAANQAIESDTPYLQQMISYIPWTEPLCSPSLILEQDIIKCHYPQKAN